MTGSSISVKGFADLPISGDFGLLGRVGIENFGVAGTSPNLGSVETKIMYLSADLLLRYHLMEGSFKPFPLLGMGLHYPLSKTSGVLDVQRISATTIFFLGGGFNYTLSDSMYLHATAEYGLFPPSNDVKTSLIAIRAGLGFTM
jgi:outer membrane protein W